MAWANLRLTLLLSTLLAFASISTDLFLPALPQMGRSLGASQDLMQYTISAYLVGFSLGQLVWGPLGDKFGRRWPIAAGLILFIIGSAGCALSSSATVLIASRLLQALGACASVVLARAIVRDLYEREQAARMLSTLMTIMAIAPLAGPSLGGLILKLADWPAIFWLLVAIGLVTLVALFSVPESLPASRRNKAPLAQAFAAYPALLVDPRLLIYAAAIGCYYAGIFAYVSSGAFAFIDYYRLSPQAFGLVFAGGIIALMLANLLNTRLVPKLGADRVLKAGAVTAVASSALAAGAAMTGVGGIAGLAAALWLFTAMNGFINANAVSGALAFFPSRAGAASALIGAFQYGGGVLGSAIAGALADGTPRPMAFVMLASGLGCLLAVLQVNSLVRGGDKSQP